MGKAKTKFSELGIETTGVTKFIPNLTRVNLLPNERTDSEKRTFGEVLIMLLYFKNLDVFKKDKFSNTEKMTKNCAEVFKQFLKSIEKKFNLPGYTPFPCNYFVYQGIIRSQILSAKVVSDSELSWTDEIEGKPEEIIFQFAKKVDKDKIEWEGDLYRLKGEVIMSSLSDKTKQVQETVWITTTPDNIMRLRKVVWGDLELNVLILTQKELKPTQYTDKKTNKLVSAWNMDACEIYPLYVIDDSEQEEADDQGPLDIDLTEKNQEIITQKDIEEEYGDVPK